MPVLLRQYLQLNASLLGFNVDPAFGDALDALMMVDLTRVPVRTLQRVPRTTRRCNVPRPSSARDGPTCRRRMTIASATLCQAPGIKASWTKDECG